MNLIDIDKIKQVRIFIVDSYHYYNHFRFEFFKDKGVLVLCQPVENIIDEENETYALQNSTQRKNLITDFVRFERRQDQKYHQLPLKEKIRKYEINLK